MNAPLRQPFLSSRRARLKQQLTFECLESRQLMASDLGLSTKYFAKYAADATKEAWSLESRLAQAAPTHAYYVDGQAESMIVNPARLALKLADGIDSTALSHWNLQAERPIGQGYAVYSSVDDSTIDRDGLVASGLVEDAVSVFFIQASRSEAVVLDEVIVALKPGVTEQDYFANNPLFSSHVPLSGTPDQFVAKVADGRGEVALHVANAIDDDPRLQFTTPNFYQNWQKFFTPNDTRFGNLWHLHNTGQGGGLVDADVDMPEAWDVNAGGSSSMVIGVVDDGISAHPDLNLWQNPVDAVDGLDNDNNGWIDDVNGWNFFSNNSSSGNLVAEDGHGTSVAGVAAASGNNGLGVVGAAYNSRVISAKIFEGLAAASDSGIASALYYVAGRTANGLGTWKAADIVNNSWGGGGNSAAINAALTWGVANGNQGKGVAFFFAAGNDAVAVDQPAVQSLFIPGVFAIGATNNQGTKSDYSNFGPALDMVTPSNDLRPGYLAIDTTDRVGAPGYTVGDYTETDPATGFGGTSSASPLAAGIAALVLAQANVQSVVLTPAQLRSYLRMNTDLIGGVAYDPVTAKHDDYGYGRLNAASAVSNLGKPEISVLSTTAEIQSAGTLSLGSVYVDEFAEAVIRIRNQGTLPLNLTSISIPSGPFSIVSAPASTNLGLGEFTTLKVRFTPTAGGATTAALSINSNDASEATFVLNLSGTALAPNILGSVFEDWDGDGVFDTPDLVKPSQTIYLDTNNNGTFDLTPTTLHNTTSTPLVDGGITTSTINVTGLTGALSDVNIRINLTHTYDSDLRISLISPGGTTVILADGVGGDGDDFTNTVFDDEAALSINSATPPFTGSLRPTQLLSAFDGGVVNGSWTLQIQDLAAADTGDLLDWDLVVSTSEPFVTSRANGAYGFLAVPNGSYTVRALAPSGWSVAGNSSYSVTVSAPTDMLRDKDFGLGQNNRFYDQVFHDFDVDGVWDNTEAPVANALLFEDTNASGTWDGSNLTLAVSPSLSIPDLTTQVSTVSASGVIGPISDVNVKVNFNMTFDGDLDVFLIAPDGTRVELFTDVGSSGQNFTNTILDDQAGLAITAGSAPFTGEFRPEGSLATLNGKNGNGTWTLEVTDDTIGDVAVLVNWEINIVSGELSFPVPTSGYGSFALTPGAHNIAVFPPAGFRKTIPGSGLHTVNVAGAPLFDQRYGLRPNNTAPTDIALSATTVAENSPIGVSVGSLSSSDADFGDTFAYTLVTGSGDTGNSQFTIDGSGALKTASPLNFESASSYSIRVRSTDQNGLSFEKNFSIGVLDVVEMPTGVSIGDATAQRSQVNKLVISFDGATTFDTGAFLLQKRGAGGGTVTTNLATATNGSGQTVATITFSGAFTRGTAGSLSDGYYQLTIDGSKVHRGSQTLDSNGDGVGGDTYVLGAAEADNFFALYGDTNGDGLVGIAEFGQFRATFGKLSADPGFNGLYDYEGDGAVGVGDFGQFRSRFGKPKLVFS